MNWVDRMRPFSSRRIPSSAPSLSIGSSIYSIRFQKINSIQLATSRRHGDLAMQMHAKRPSPRGGKGTSGPTLPEGKKKKTPAEGEEDEDDILSLKRRGGGPKNNQMGEGEEDDQDADEDEEGEERPIDGEESGRTRRLDDDDDEAEEDEDEEEGDRLADELALPRGMVEDLGYEEAMMKNKAERANPRLGKVEALNEEDLRLIREKKEAAEAALRPFIPGD
jgi:hypothetical protein